MQKTLFLATIFFGQCRTLMLGILGNLIGLRRGKMTFNQASIDQAIGALKEQFGNRLSVAQSVREQHGHTTTRMANQPPDAVIFVKTAEEVSSIMQTCHRLGCPVIAFGTSSSLEGHINAPHGGISIDMSQLDQVIEVNNEDLDVVVQPGVTREWLNNYLRDNGLFFPIDPMAGTMQVQEFDAQPPADISSLAR